MAITVDWAVSPYEVLVPRADMTLIQSNPTEIRQLDADVFHKALRDIEVTADGRAGWGRTHDYNATVLLSGVTYALVMEVLAPYTITFEDGLYNVNIVGGNTNIPDRVNKNQVGVNTANSAGLVDLDTLVSGAYQGKTVVSPTKGQAGTDKPIGTFQKPSNNMLDALAISVIEGTPSFLFLENMTLNEDFSSGYSFIGDNPNNVLTINSIANVSTCSITNLTLQGELDGLNTVRECALLNCTSVSGFIFQCSMLATITFIGNTQIMQSFSLYATLDLTLATSIVVRDHNGGLEITGMQSGDNTFGGAEGVITIASTCVGGTIHIQGEWQDIIDNSGPGCTVLDERKAISQPTIDSITSQVWQEPVTNLTTSGSIGEYVLKKVLSFTKFFGTKDL